MKLVIVRHGDPDYERDSLTEKGIREAECLIPRIAKLDFKECYVSPLGRAQLTCKIGMKEKQLEPVTLDWLQEVPTDVERPHDPGNKTIAWDWLPKDWAFNENFYQYEHWMEHPNFDKSNVREVIENIYRNFDEFLKNHGYQKQHDTDSIFSGRTFKVTKANNDTIVLFCHFGLECVLLSYLLNMSPMILWHGFCARTTSITTVATEERVKGEASFRVIEYGDTSHLYVAGEPNSFSARFCECYDNTEERHN